MRPRVLQPSDVNTRYLLSSVSNITLRRPESGPGLTSSHWSSLSTVWLATRFTPLRLELLTNDTICNRFVPGNRPLIVVTGTLLNLRPGITGASFHYVRNANRELAMPKCFEVHGAPRVEHGAFRAPRTYGLGRRSWRGDFASDSPLSQVMRKPVYKSGPTKPEFSIP